MKNKLWLAVILITVGILARLYQFGQVPPSLYWDEVAIGLDARALVQTGHDLDNRSWLQPLFYSYGDYKAPVYIWLVTLIGKVAGVTEATIRLPNLLAGFGLGVLVFLLARQVRKEGSQLSWFVLANLLLMPWAFHFSRIGMESFLSLFWVSLMVYLSVIGLRRKQWWLVGLAAVPGVLGLYSYIAARVLVVGLYLATYLLFGWGKRKQQLPGLIIGLAIIGLGIGLLVTSPDYAASQQYRLSNDNLVRTTEHIKQSVAAQGEVRPLLVRLTHHRFWYWGQAYLTNYLTHFGPDFWLFTGDTNLRHHSGFGGELLLVQGLLMIVGLGMVAKSFQKMDGLMILWLLLAPCVAALVNEVPHASRAVYMIVPLSWFLGRGLAGLIERKKAGRWLGMGVAMALLVNFGVYLHDYFVHYPSRSQLAWLAPYKQAALFFKDQEASEPVFVTQEWYQPGLYWAFYQEIPAAKLQQSPGEYLTKLGRFTFDLPQSCPAGAWCVASPDWQTDSSQTLQPVPGANELVIKVAK